MSQKIHSALSSIKTYLLKPRVLIIEEPRHYSGRMIQYGYPMPGTGRPRRRRNKKAPPPVLTTEELDELFPEKSYIIPSEEIEGQTSDIFDQDNITSAATVAAAEGVGRNFDAGAECKHEHTGSNDEDRCCSICIEEFIKDDRVRVLSCGHFFHSDCIKLWLVERHAVCPMCKVEFGRAKTADTVAS